MSARRGSGEKNASGERIGSPMISRRLFPSGLPCLKSSSEAPGRPTTLNVGFGMYSEITLRTAIFVRPLTSTYLISPEYSGGRNFVKASVVSYMWLSASKTGKSIMGFGMATSVMTGLSCRRSSAADCWFSTSTSILHDNAGGHNGETVAGGKRPCKALHRCSTRTACCRPIPASAGSLAPCTRARRHFPS